MLTIKHKAIDTNIARGERMIVKDAMIIGKAIVSKDKLKLK